MRNLLAILLLTVSLAIRTTSACAADNCLRAVRGTHSPHPSVQDCSSYLRATVTPATVTSTVTQTNYFTGSDTLSLTATNTAFQTSTVVVPTTLTVVLSLTSTTTLQAAAVAAKVKRQATVVPSKIPPYASPCSGSVRYSSACSCIGVTAIALTLPAPTTVVTTQLTISTTTTFTDFKTITISPTVATVTRTTTVSTLTQTTYIATVTAYGFILQVASNAGQAAGNYIQAKPDTIGGGGSPPLLEFTTVRSDATKFVLLPDGRLVSAANGWVVYAGWYNSGWTSSYLYLFANPFTGTYALSCSLNAAWEITCTGSPQPYVILGTYNNGYSLNIAQAGFNFGSISGVAVTVKALPP
ncbi:hypothetical protein TWF694_001321 [Orbilia ellipsospora]|uniref:Membrane-associated protein n=1 Tax=Orbilia ellipsospora TaxID=2528407 RepID=A0AAV9XSV6_9PEZI